MAFQRVAITDFTAGELSYKFYGRFDLEVYSKGCVLMENWVPFSQGGITTRPGTEFLGGTLGNAAGRLIPFSVSDTDCFILELTALAMRIWKDDAVMSLPNPPIAPTDPITTPYTLAELPYIQIQKVSNKMFFVHRSHPIMVLEWEGLRNFSFLPLTITCGTDIDAWVASASYSKDDIVTNGTPKKIYKCVVAGTTGTTGPLTEDDLIVDGTAYWTWEYTQPFSQVDDYPGCVAYFLQRMWFAGSNNDPDVAWASMPGDFGCFDYFDIMEYTGTQLVDSSLWAYPEVPETEVVYYHNTVIGDGNAIILELASTQDESIMWLCGSDALIIGTATSEWVIPPDVTALNIVAKIRSRLGSSKIQAMVIGENPIFVQGTMMKGYVREYEYLASDATLSSPDLTYMAEHMLKDGVEQMDFQQVPQPHMYFVSDGDLMCLLYSKQYKTLAWFRFTTGEGGQIESVAVIPGEEDDQVYLIVNRPGGRWVEKVGDLWAWGPKLDSWYHVDAALASTSGLDRFDGDTVYVYDDDAESFREGEVAGGVLDTTPELGHAIWIGLPVTSTLTTLPLQTGSSTGGTGQTGIKRIGNVYARVIASWPFEAGTDLDHMQPAHTADDAVWNDKNYYSGDVRLPMEGDWERYALINIRHTSPYSATILALVAEVDV
jgi:hypothetical protein